MKETDIGAHGDHVKIVYYHCTSLSDSQLQQFRFFFILIFWNPKLVRVDEGAQTSRKCNYADNSCMLLFTLRNFTTVLFSCHQRYYKHLVMIDVLLCLAS